MGQCLRRARPAPAPSPTSHVSSPESQVSFQASTTSDLTPSSSFTSSPESTLRVVPEPCQLPVAACLMELDRTWASRLQRIGLGMSDAQQSGWLEWLGSNEEVTAGWVGSKGVAVTWADVCPGAEAPHLQDQQLCVYYRWTLSRSWYAMDAIVLSGGNELCCGGTASTRAMQLCGARLIVSDRAERLEDRVFELRHDDRVFRLSGVPLPDGAVLESRLEGLRRVHRAGGPTVAAGAIELLPAAVEDDAAVMSTRLAEFVGLSARHHTVVAAGARLNVAVCLAGLMSKPRRPLYRVCDATEPAAFVLHSRGHQHLLLTVLRQGRLEMQLELPSCTHLR